MIRILSTSPAFGRHGRVPARLAALGWTVEHADTAEDLARCLPDADFLVVGLLPLTADLVANAPRLRGALKHGVGTNNIDTPACTARGIPVLNTPGANADAVAELALGLILSLARHIPASHALVTGGGWARPVGREIAGAALGIVGLGTIGQKLARRALALGMTVAATDPRLYPDFLAEHPVEMLPLDALLGRSDFVSLHLSGTTRVLGEAELARMNPGAFLLNLARGEVIDIDALAAALDAGMIAGAALDVFTVEPPDRAHPIFQSPRVIFTPHSGGNSEEAVERIGLMNVEDIETLLSGGRPARVVNPEAIAETFP